MVEDDMKIAKTFTLPLSVMAAAREKANEAGLTMSQACTQAFETWLRSKR